MKPAEVVYVPETLVEWGNVPIGCKCGYAIGSGPNDHSKCFVIRVGTDVNFGCICPSCGETTYKHKWPRLEN